MKKETTMVVGDIVRAAGFFTDHGGRRVLYRRGPCGTVSPLPRMRSAPCTVTCGASGLKGINRQWDSSPLAGFLFSPLPKIQDQKNFSKFKDFGV